MATYTVGIVGCGRIASLLEQETHRGNPNTHAGCFDYCRRTQMRNGYTLSGANGMYRGSTPVGKRCWQGHSST